MIDLEDALAPLVEHAPEPPDVAGVVRHGRTRRRRRAAVLATTLVVVVVLAIGAIATIADRSTPRVLGPPADVDHVRVTLLDGSQLEISGPPSLGLTHLEPSFNAELDWYGQGIPQSPNHSFTVQRDAPVESGTVLGNYPTGDGHELVLYETADGVDAVVQYPGWALVVHWNSDPTSWALWANGLHASVGADGFLVIEPPHPWRLGPTDAPDVQLGDAYGFFSPTHERCLGTFLSSDELCSADRVLTRAFSPVATDALGDIDVEYTPAPPTP